MIRPLIGNPVVWHCALALQSGLELLALHRIKMATWVVHSGYSEEPSGVMIRVRGTACMRDERLDYSYRATEPWCSLLVEV
jgi:hypothetical protein